MQVCVEFLIISISRRSNDESVSVQLRCFSKSTTHTFNPPSVNAQYGEFNDAIERIIIVRRNQYWSRL